MLAYVIGFIIIGFVLGLFVKDISRTGPIIFGISILWGLISGPIWGFVAFGELILGGFIFIKLTQGNQSTVFSEDSLCKYNKLNHNDRNKTPFGQSSHVDLASGNAAVYDYTAEKIISAFKGSSVFLTKEEIQKIKDEAIDIADNAGQDYDVVVSGLIAAALTAKAKAQSKS